MPGYAAKPFIELHQQLQRFSAYHVVVGENDASRL
jgi:hypothetical protein